MDGRMDIPSYKAAMAISNRSNRFFSIPYLEQWNELENYSYWNFEAFRSIFHRRTQIFDSRSLSYSVKVRVSKLVDEGVSEYVSV